MIIDLTRLLRYGTVIVSVIMAGAVAVSTFYQDRRMETETQWVITDETVPKAVVANLRSDVDALKKAVRDIEALPREAKLALKLQQIQVTISDVQLRQTKLEQILLNNPAKALELPLLQRDFEGLKTAHQATAASLKETVDRIYDLNKWLLGGIAISVIALALGNFLIPKGSDGKASS
jgi:hypothetical protein